MGDFRLDWRRDERLPCMHTADLFDGFGLRVYESFLHPGQVDAWAGGRQLTLFSSLDEAKAHCEALALSLVREGAEKLGYRLTPA